MSAAPGRLKQARTEGEAEATPVSAARPPEGAQHEGVSAKTRLALLALCALAIVACSDAGKSIPVPTATATAATEPAARPVAMARGIVELPGGLVELGAAVDGVVASVAVQEGDSVKAGQLLLRLASEQQTQDLAQAQAELQVTQARQAAQQARLPALAQQARRLAEAARAQAVDAQRADEAQQALVEAQAALGIAQAETALARQKLSAAQSRVKLLSVRAPHDASVLKILVQPGTQVWAQAGKPLVSLLPTRALRVRAEVNETYASRIKPGMRADIYLDGDLAGAARTLRADAKVQRISPVFSASRLDDAAQPRGIVRVVDCFLELDRAVELRVGQAVRVEFHE